MTEILSTINKICKKEFGRAPESISRCSTGIGNYVYCVELPENKYIIRLSEEKSAYEDSVSWLQRLAALKVPVPEVLAMAELEGFSYMLISFIDGMDLGEIYRSLSREDKLRIAKEVVAIQNRAAKLPVGNIAEDWSWEEYFPEAMLDRAQERIGRNFYFEPERVQRLRAESCKLKEYFKSVKPVAYLDDISTKNLMICDGHVSGIVDVDWIGMGDRLTFAALTHVALLNYGYDTEYVDFVLAEMKVTEVQRQVFLFYCLIYCVDFMGERGMDFLGKTVPVNSEIINRLNNIYDLLWQEWISKYK